MALTVDGSADIHCRELDLIRKSFKNVQLGKLVRRMRMKVCTLFDLAKKSCKLGICRSQMEVTAKKRGPSTCGSNRRWDGNDIWLRQWIG